MNPRTAGNRPRVSKGALMTADASASSSGKTIVLIHGLFLTWSSWESGSSASRRTAFGCLAPGWPGLDRSVEELRADPTPPHQALDRNGARLF